MTVEIGILTAAGIGISAGALLTGWCLYSRYLEKRDAQ